MPPLTPEEMNQLYHATLSALAETRGELGILIKDLDNIHKTIGYLREEIAELSKELKDGHLRHSARLGALETDSSKAEGSRSTGTRWILAIVVGVLLGGGGMLANFHQRLNDEHDRLVRLEYKLEFYNDTLGRIAKDKVEQ